MEATYNPPLSGQEVRERRPAPRHWHGLVVVVAVLPHSSRAGRKARAIPSRPQSCGDVPPHEEREVGRPYSPYRPCPRELVNKIDYNSRQ